MRDFSSRYDGAPCPVPKYAGFHGFRNKYDPTIDVVFQKYDIDHLKHHEGAVQMIG